jgi:demethylmenaquinone methyltransferase / 2-methoxy-6-polyprenyl-1,4-benzoquinol methylase
VLKPGGQLGVLEFSEPGGILGKAYGLYFHRILPAIGRLVCGKDGPYAYLPESVGNFPSPPELLSLISSCGYRDRSWKPYTLGVAGLYSATRSE